jgi:hypothetical protein
MKSPLRGALSASSPHVIRVLAALLSVLASGCASNEGLGAPLDPGNTEMPAGCQQSVCDYLYAWCTDPCAECWKTCGRVRDEFGVIRCSQTCTATCTRDNTATLSPCDAQLTDCRSTKRNTVCIDQLAADIPRDLPPCSSEMSAARCACGKDAVCQALLEQFNPLCEECDWKWIVPCIDAACKRELDATSACLQATRCSDIATCPACRATAEALSTCVKNAQQDPSDIGGCYSGPRHCTQEPLCPYDPL